MESLKYFIILLFISTATIMSQPSGDVSFLNSKVGWVEGGGVGKKTTDGGLTWTNANIVNGRFQFTSELTANAVSGFYFYRTTDGGTTWASQFVTNNNELLDISMIDQNLGFVCGSQGYVYKTTDGGITWVSQFIMSDQLNAIYFMDLMVLEKPVF